MAAMKPQQPLRHAAGNSLYTPRMVSVSPRCLEPLRSHQLPACPRLMQRAACRCSTHSASLRMQGQQAANPLPESDGTRATTDSSSRSNSAIPACSSFRPVSAPHGPAAATAVTAPAAANPSVTSATSSSISPTASARSGHAASAAPLRPAENYFQRRVAIDNTWLRHDPAAPEQGLFRFWHDERRFKGTGETSLAQRAMLAAGGIRTGGNIKSATSAGPQGHQRPRDWDVLWSPAATALKAADKLRAGQLISAVPGLACLSKKKLLPDTLIKAYGESAFDIIPRTFRLPHEALQWRNWMESHPGTPDAPDTWILKTAQHLGKGLKIVPSSTALMAALRRSKEAHLARSKDVRPFVVAQQYVANPLLLEGGRKFGVRLWVLVTRGADPLRAYVHKNGLVLFSNDTYDSGTLSSLDGTPAQGHVTNYAQNVDGGVWSLKQLNAALGKQKFRTLYERMLRSTARICAAAMATMRREGHRTRLPNESAFELLGLDFLVDAELHPWLLEVNATPSLAVEHSDAQVSAMIMREKNGMVQDMVDLLRLRERFRRPPPDLLARAREATAHRAAAVAAESASSATSGIGAVFEGPSPRQPQQQQQQSRARARPARTSREAVRESLQAHCPEAFYDHKVLDMLTAAELEMRNRGGFLPLMELFEATEASEEEDGYEEQTTSGSSSTTTSGSSSSSMTVHSDVPDHTSAITDGEAGEEEEEEAGQDQVGSSSSSTGGSSGVKAGIKWGPNDVQLRAWLRTRRQLGTMQ